MTQILGLKDGVHLVSCSQDGSVRIWDVLKEKEKDLIKDFEGSVNCISLSPDQKTLVSGSSDRMIKVFKLSYKFDERRQKSIYDTCALEKSI